MRNIPSRLLTVFLLVVFAVVLAGCASSPPSKFYQLDALNGQTATSHQGSEVVSVGPLRIPDYLDRPEIVIRSGSNELKLAEFNRWAGSIESDITRALVEDISTQLPPDRFFVIQWTPLLQSQLSSSYRVEMIVNSFDGPLAGPVTLKAKWAVFGKDKNLLLRKESVVVEQVKGNGYDAYVNAMSRAVEKLGKEIADGIASKAAT
jgi:uncharacterized lipoprotein YmbA